MPRAAGGRGAAPRGGVGGSGTAPAPILPALGSGGLPALRSLDRAARPRPVAASRPTWTGDEPTPRPEVAPTSLRREGMPVSDPQL